jgi:hypothetical protein
MGKGILRASVSLVEQLRLAIGTQTHVRGNAALAGATLLGCVYAEIGKNLIGDSGDGN